MLKDRYEFEYCLDHLLPCCVRLFLSFDEFNMLYPRTFIFLSWLGTSFHFVVTCLTLWDMFIDPFFTLYIYCGPNTSFFVWSLIQFSTRCSYCHYRKVKDTFSHLHFFLESCLDHLIIFLYWAWVESESEIFCYRWSIDLMTVLFFTPHPFSGSLIEIL